MLAELELERRKPVWTAFSELWLDTELYDSDLIRIASIAAASGYTVAELREIYLYEVAPVVAANALSIVGEWLGFDEEWLHSNARKHAEHRSLGLRVWVASGIGRWIMTYATEGHWKRIVALLPAANETPPPSDTLPKR